MMLEEVSWFLQKKYDGVKITKKANDIYFFIILFKNISQIKNWIFFLFSYVQTFSQMFKVIWVEIFNIFQKHK